MLLSSKTTMEARDVLTLAIAAFGAIFGAVGTVTGILALWHQLDLQRVKHRIRPMGVTMVSAPDGEPTNKRNPTQLFEGPESGFCIEVTNLSSFPVIIKETGFTARHKKRFPIHGGVIDGGPWPRRLEPRETVTTYFTTDQFTQPIGKAYALTTCLVKSYGDSPARRALCKQILRKSNGR